jgi:hypothetical protein
MSRVPSFMKYLAASKSAALCAPQRVYERGTPWRAAPKWKAPSTRPTGFVMPYQTAGFELPHSPRPMDTMAVVGTRNPSSARVHCSPREQVYGAASSAGS